MVRTCAADESGAMDNASPTTEQPAPPPGDPSPTGPRVSRDEMKDLGRLRRSITDRRIAGVAGGIARHLDIDPIIVRVALVVAVFFGGAGLLAYLGAWALVPEEGTDDQPLGLDVRSRSLALAGVGVLAVLCAVGDWAGAFWFPWPLAIVAAVVVWFLNRNDRRARRSGYGHDYAQPASSETAYVPGVDTSAAAATYGAPGHGEYARAPRRSRNPRRRGPLLFLFTLALVALAEGVLGVVDLAGASVTGSAYPALALGIIAVMLLVGSFWGRAGGLVALGVVAAIATVGATMSDTFPEDRFDYSPTSASQVEDGYDFGGGDFTLDLSGVSDVDALDGRDITIDGVVGRVEVIVPRGMDVSVGSQVVAGDSRVFDNHQDGFDFALDDFLDGGDQVPDMSIAIDLVAGEVIVREAS
jgi:phage shock protein PspC (stress-responsive transcriptional regulator)